MVSLESVGTLVFPLSLKSSVLKRQPRYIVSVIAYANSDEGRQALSRAYEFTQSPSAGNAAEAIMEAFYRIVTDKYRVESGNAGTCRTVRHQHMSLFSTRSSFCYAHNGTLLYAVGDRYVFIQ